MSKGKYINKRSGYVYTNVGRGHHLAYAGGGYVPTHRLIAEQMLGRRLKEGEVVHHKNGKRDDNRPENLEVFKSTAHHRVKHRKRKDLRRPDEPNLLIECACGCNQKLLKYDKENRPRKRIYGHQLVKLTRQDVEEIKRRVSLGEPHRAIAKIFGVDKSTVSRVNSRRGLRAPM
jgi:hypothetical protein